MQATQTREDRYGQINRLLRPLRAALWFCIFSPGLAWDLWRREQLSSEELLPMLIVSMVTVGALVLWGQLRIEKAAGLH
jgi:hypothetical protein